MAPDRLTWLPRPIDRRLGQGRTATPDRRDTMRTQAQQHDLHRSPLSSTRGRSNDRAQMVDHRTHQALSLQRRIGNQAVQHSLRQLPQLIQQSTWDQKQIIQRTLLPRDRDCSNTTALPIHETATVRYGVHHTQTFSRPTSGRIRVTVRAESAERDCTFGVDVWQCHIVGDEPIEEQHIETVGNTIAYEIPLPSEKWNTYDKFALRIRVNCGADLEVTVAPA